MNMPIHLQKIVHTGHTGFALYIERAITDEHGIFKYYHDIATVRNVDTNAELLFMGAYIIPKETTERIEKTIRTMVRHIAESIDLPPYFRKKMASIPRKTAKHYTVPPPIIGMGQISIEVMPTERDILDTALEKTYEYLGRAGYAKKEDSYYVFYNPWNGKEIRFRRKKT